MKTLVLAVVLLFATAARADTFDATIDRATTNNLAVRDELVKAQTELAFTKASAATALEEKAKADAVTAKEKADLKGEIKKRDKTLSSPWVQAALKLRAAFWIVLGCYFGLGIFAIIGGVLTPGGAMFKLSSTIIRSLPLGNWVRWGINLFQETTTVRAEKVPSVTPLTIVTPPSPDPQYAANLAAMAAVSEPTYAPAPPSPAPSAMAQAFYGTRTVGEIMQGVGRRTGR